MKVDRNYKEVYHGAEQPYDKLESKLTIQQ